MRPHDRQAGLALLSAAEAGQLMCYMPEQVATEFVDHDQPVQDEADRNLKRVREQLDRINILAGVYGTTATVDLSHLDDHVPQARAIVGRWLTQLQTAVPSDTAPAKAFARVNAGRAPAKRGKDSSKDCLVYETLLELATALRAAGTTTPIVFLSSNTTEYFTEGSKLKAEIAADFAPLNLTYAANMRAAKYELGL